MIIPNAIAEFRRLHGGAPPTEVLVTPEAAVVVAAQESLAAFQDGVPVRVGAAPDMAAPAAGGTRVVLLLAQLPGGRVGVVAGQSGPDAPAP